MEQDGRFLRCCRYGAGYDVKAALLGKDARYAPDRTFDTLHVKLALTVDFKRRAVSGTCTTSIRSFVDGLDSLVFDAAGMRVSRVRFQGRPARFSHEDSRLRVRVSRRLAALEEGEVEIRYSVVEPKNGLHFVYPGAHNRRNPVQLWSQGQPEDSRFWFPCHDAPHEKATSEMIATVPRGFTAVSNGVLVGRRRDAAGRTETFHWRMHQPHSLYLVTLTVGRFAEIKDRWEHIPVVYYCEKGREADARRGFGKTPKAMEFFSKSLGVRYPYEKYAQVAVAEYPGGMENTTATTQTDACLIDARAALDTDLDMLVAHELAHQWFGDLLTCRDWSHAWLNEGFATYFEVLFTGHDKGQDELDYELHRNQQAYFDEDEQRYRRPIVCNTYKHPWALFDRHLYEKGGWVLHMLRAELGDELWWKAIGHYARKFRNQSVDTGDLIGAIEESTGRNLRPFFDQWVFRAGYPKLKIHYAYDAKARKARIALTQTQPVSDEAPAFRLLVEFRFDGAGWSREFKERMDAKERRFEFKLPGEPLAVEFDPEHRLLKKVEFRKPFSLWLRQLQRAPRAQSRALAAREVALWGGLEAVEALARALRREKFWGAAAEIALALGSIRTEGAFRALKGFLDARHPRTRRAVVQGLAEFRRPELAALLKRLLRRDPSLHVQAEAARALGALRDPSLAPALTAKLRERSYMDVLQGGAIQGLAATRDPKVLPLLKRATLPPFAYPARAYAARALSQFAPVSAQVVPWLCGMLSGVDERINLSVISALGRIEDPRALPALEDARDESPNTRVKTYAEEAIARIRGEASPAEAAASGKPKRRKK